MNGNTELNQISNELSQTFQPVTSNELFKRLITRCSELDLIIHKPEAESLGELSAYLATLISNYLFTGHFKRRI